MRKLPKYFVYAYFYYTYAEISRIWRGLRNYVKTKLHQNLQGENEKPISFSKCLQRKCVQCDVSAVANIKA